MSSAARDKDSLTAHERDAAAAVSAVDRIWIGNIDPRLSEFRLVRLLQLCGTLSRFEFLLHRDGPQAGRPRGFAFASFSTQKQAQRAIRQLDGQQLGEKQLRLRWAHEGGPKPKESASVPAAQVISATDADEDAVEEPPSKPIQEKEEAAAPTAADRADNATAAAACGARARIRAIEASLAALEQQQSCEAAAAAVPPALGQLPRIRPSVAIINALHQPASAQPSKRKYVNDVRHRPRPYKPRSRF